MRLIAASASGATTDNFPRTLAVISANTKNLRRPCAPTRSLRDRPRFAASLVEPVEAGIGIGLKDSSVSFEMALGVIAGPVARVEEHGCRRIMTPEREENHCPSSPAM